MVPLLYFYPPFHNSDMPLNNIYIYIILRQIMLEFAISGSIEVQTPIFNYIVRPISGLYVRTSHLCITNISQSFVIAISTLSKSHLSYTSSGEYQSLRSQAFDWLSKRCLPIT